jgi:hypothetical protein
VLKNSADRIYNLYKIKNILESCEAFADDLNEQLEELKDLAKP